MSGAKKTAKKANPWRTETEKKKRTIVERMKALGIYRAQYMAAIDRLALIYVQLAELESRYKELGGNPLVEHTNKAGATNTALHPCMEGMMQLRTQALAHERELGLTPAAMKKLGEVECGQKKSPLEAGIEKLLKSG